MLLSKTICNCKEFLLPSLITGVAHLMNYAKFNVLNNFEKGMSVFSVLIANPSTGKSPAIEIIKNALETIEIYEGIKEENSCLVNGLFWFSNVLFILLQLTFYSHQILNLT